MWSSKSLLSCADPCVVGVSTSALFRLESITHVFLNVRASFRWNSAYVVCHCF